ncbi:hypothetical protein [Ruminococcus sp.]|uniref:hypothetical protein n=1 Tax=Ruminococcus sp. TaxID=41978 RepID=UPI0025FBED42|nr:hypothetical protein [Ruminococcus sp.]
MKKVIARIAVLLVSVVMMASASVSCNDKDDHDHDDHDHNLVEEIPDDVNMKLDDMPYGGEFRKLLPEEFDTPIGVDRDPRYLSDEEAAKFADYFYAISEKKPEYLEKALHPDFLKTLLEKTGTDSAQSYVDIEYNLIKEFTETDYSFDFVLVDDMVTDEDIINGYSSTVRSSLPGAKITDVKVFKINCTYKSLSDEGGSYSLKERLGDYVTLCVYTADGEPYILF